VKVKSLFYIECKIARWLRKTCNYCSMNNLHRKIKIYSDVGRKCKLCMQRVLCIKCNLDMETGINFEIFSGNSWNFLCTVYDFYIP
jgi:hypothetical protein